MAKSQLLLLGSAQPVIPPNMHVIDWGPQVKLLESWCYHGVTMVFRYYQGVTMVLLWYNQGVTMLLLWCYHVVGLLTSIARGRLHPQPPLQ